MLGCLGRDSLVCEPCDWREMSLARGRMREKSHHHPSRGPGGLFTARGGLGGDRRSLGEKSGELSLKDVQKARVAH